MWLKIVKFCLPASFLTVHFVQMFFGFDHKIPLNKFFNLVTYECLNSLHKFKS